MGPRRGGFSEKDEGRVRAEHKWALACGRAGELICRLSSVFCCAVLSCQPSTTSMSFTSSSRLPP